MRRMLSTRMQRGATAALAVALALVAGQAGASATFTIDVGEVASNLAP